MLPSQQNDYFGNETNQVESYDKFRPLYPQDFISSILKHCTIKNNYLDVACGTGQLLLDLNSQFSRSVGVDISPQQIKVLQQKINQKNLSQTVSAHVCDIHSLQQFSKENNIPQTYDLITVAQALHWFDINKFIQEVSSNLMTQNKESVFAVTSYYSIGNDFIIDENNDSLDENGEEFFQEFYKIVKPYFAFDQDIIYGQYNQTNFASMFKEVERKETVVKGSCNIFELSKYLKTFSAYNTYTEKKRNEPNYVDPIEPFEKALNERVNLIQKRTGKVLSNPIRIKNFFYIRIFKRL